MTQTPSGPPRYPTSSSTPPPVSGLGTPAYGSTAPWQPAPVQSPQTSWPTVVGIIMIVLGALGSCINLWGVVAPVVMQALLSTTQDQDPSTQAAAKAMAEHRVILTISGVMNLVLAAMLLTAGILLVKRSAGAARLSVIYAWLRIAGAVLAGFATYQMQQTQVNHMMNTSAMPPNMSPQMFMNIMLVVTVVFTVLWGWALPIFLLIWFNRRKIKDEVAGWE